MPTDGNDVVFKAETPPASSEAGNLAELEVKTFGRRGPKENAVVIPLWKGGYISFNPKDSVSIFALLALVLLLVVSFLVTLIGLGIGDVGWMETLTVALGHAITGVVGAIVGSAASKDKSD